MEKVDALGFIEVVGLVPGIEAADAMVKSANVRLLRQYEVRPGLVTVMVEGNLGACRAAVDAGTAAAGRIGTVVASHVIPRPDNDTENLVLAMISRPDPKNTTKPGGQSGKPQTKTAVTAEAVAPTEKAAPVVPTEKAGKAKKAKEVKAESPAGADDVTPAVMERVMAFIASGARGKNWNDLSRQFPAEAKLLRGALDAAVRLGTLEKVGARYRVPEVR